MAAQTRSEGQRIAFLEGQIAHLATKADLAALEARTGHQDRRAAR